MSSLNKLFEDESEEEVKREKDEARKEESFDLSRLLDLDNTSKS